MVKSSLDMRLSYYTPLLQTTQVAFDVSSKPRQSCVTALLAHFLIIYPLFKLRFCLNCAIINKSSLPSKLETKNEKNHN